jgi:predicted dehydrogenase
MDKLRIGTLGAARITPMALLGPARRVAEVEVTAVAARDPERARAYARKHAIPRVHSSYDDLIADPEVDAIYNPLPNSHHFEWSSKALIAGKHVLCEKPFTANAAEAERLAAQAERSGRVLMEAFHYRYHPLAERMHQVVRDGLIGRLERIETWMCIPLPLPGDIRYRFELAGGATMDVGSYAIHMLRLLGGEEPEVVSANVRLSSPLVDRFASAEFRFPAGHTGRMTCSLFSSTLLKVAVFARGDRGEMRVFNPVGPQFLYHHLKIVRDGHTVTERFTKEATYVFQLRAFAGAVLRGAPILTPPADSVANMRVIDAVYRAAGLPVRGTPP